MTLVNVSLTDDDYVQVTIARQSFILSIEESEQLKLLLMNVLLEHLELLGLSISSDAKRFLDT